MIFKKIFEALSPQPQLSPCLPCQSLWLMQRNISNHRIPTILVGLFRTTNITGSIPAVWHVQKKSTIRAPTHGIGSMPMGRWHTIKDVYLHSNGGKWVRYDSNGHMVKGEDYRYDGWYLTR
jgi:hypothetical protein